MSCIVSYMLCRIVLCASAVFHRFVYIVCSIVLCRIVLYRIVPCRILRYHIVLHSGKLCRLQQHCDVECAATPTALVGGNAQRLGGVGH